MDLDMLNLEQENFSPQVSGTEKNDTLIPMNDDICNTITNVMDLEPSVTGNSVFQCKQDSNFNRLDELVKITKMSPHNFTVSDNHDISGDLVDSLSLSMQKKDVDCRPNQKKRGIVLRESKCDNNMDRNLLSDMQKEGLDHQTKQKKRKVVLLDNKHNFSVKNKSNTKKQQPSDLQRKGMKGSFDSRSEWKVREATLCEDETNDTNNSVSSTFGKKCKRKMIRLKDMQLNMRCEWQNCNYCTSIHTEFMNHVSLHIPHLELKEGVYACLWKSCGFQSSNPQEMTRHVNFHSFHTKIKCIGSNILAESRQPGCTYIDVGRNMLPDFPSAFECCWDDCERTFNNSQKFYHHVQKHIFHIPDDRREAKCVPCGWRGCKSVFRAVSRLEEHARRHTQEKCVGCPTCGDLFANKVKFLDHCQRQLPVEMRGYQCEHCGKCYASKRLLAKHIIHHANTYQCSFCDKTCPLPSRLATHIRYKHLDFKPFKCHTCDYAAKTQNDLNNHLATHFPVALHRCREEGCGCSFRSAYGLRRHSQKYHCGYDVPEYCCHICDDLFHRGSTLTLHLKKMHNILRPSGQSRFRYKLEEDGYYWLQRAQPVQSRPVPVATVASSAE